MNKLNCPHCGMRGISVLRKMFLGPALPARCTECGKKIGVPHASMLLYGPIGIIAVVITSLAQPLVLKIAVLVVLVAVAGIASVRWVPLQAR